MKITEIIPKAFTPTSEWKADISGPIWKGDSTPKAMYIVDTKTGKKYSNHNANIVRLGCAFAAVASPLMQVFHLAAKIFCRFKDTFALIGKDMTFKAKLQQAGKNLLIIVAMPLIYVALELSAIYGIFDPLNGRKLYASLERLAGDEGYVMPGFQPVGEKATYSLNFPEVDPSPS